MADDEPLSGPERDLMRLASRDAPDEFLMALQAMAKQRLHEQVGLLVNGMIVIGELGDPEVLASLLQVRRGAQIERAERPDGLSDEEWDQLAQDWISEPVRMVEDLQAREAAVDEALEPYLEPEDGPPRSREIPAELERQLEGFRTSSHITLTNATITVEPGGQKATTDSEGNFALPLAPGQYKIKVTAPNLQPQELDVTIEANSVAIKNIDLRK